VRLVYSWNPKSDSMKTLLICTALIAWAGLAWAQDATKVVKAEEVTWKDHPVFPGAYISMQEVT
jgi:hypothetical protein